MRKRQIQREKPGGVLWNPADVGSNDMKSKYVLFLGVSKQNTGMLNVMNINSTGQSQLEGSRLLDVCKCTSQNKFTGGFGVSWVSLEINRGENYYLCGNKKTEIAANSSASMTAHSEIGEGGSGRESLLVFLIDRIVHTGRKEEKHICLCSTYLTGCSKNWCLHSTLRVHSSCSVAAEPSFL